MRTLPFVARRFSNVCYSLFTPCVLLGVNSTRSMSVDILHRQIQADRELLLWVHLWNSSVQGCTEQARVYLHLSPALYTRQRQ